MFKEAFKIALNVKGSKLSFGIIVVGGIATFIIPSLLKNWDSSARFFAILVVCLAIGMEVQRFTGLMASAYEQLTAQEEKKKAGK